MLGGGWSGSVFADERLHTATRRGCRRRNTESRCLTRGGGAQAPQVRFVERGLLEIKGKGKLECFFLDDSDEAAEECRAAAKRFRSEAQLDLATPLVAAAALPKLSDDRGRRRRFSSSTVEAQSAAVRTSKMPSAT